jgi:hypothetical protein
VTPRLEACYFADGVTPVWPRLAAVLEMTAREHCPDWLVNVRSIAPTAVNHRLGSRTVIRNTQKLEEWARIVASAQDGERLLLIDADTFVVQPLDPVWDLDFDVAITTKPRQAHYPINGGVVFLRMSAAVRRFFEAWRDVNCRMLHDPGLHHPWKRKYAGINQAALGCLLEESRPADVRILELPCTVWNCEDFCWSEFDPTVTRIVHVKSALQIACLRNPVPEEFKELASLWRSLDSRTRGVAA